MSRLGGTFFSEDTDRAIEGTSAGKISDFLNIENTNVGAAIEAASLVHTSVDFEGLPLSTDDAVVIASNSKCVAWYLNGASLTFTSSSLIFNNKMTLIDMGGGELIGGLKLATVSTTGSTDTQEIIVADIGDFVVGDIVNSSLDIEYLPNASDRRALVGPDPEGDFNRIETITGTGPHTITTSYKFLRTTGPGSNPGVVSGLFAGARIANGSFNSNGMQFKATEQHVEFRNGTLKKWQGYFISIADGNGLLRKSTLYLRNINIDESFLDIMRFQGKGITFDNVNVSRQFDLSKQLAVVNTPFDTGVIIFKNGCHIARKNLDAELFIAQLDVGQAFGAECGNISIDDTCIFDGTAPTDIPISDFEDGGTIFFGLNVSTGDTQHWMSVNITTVKLGNFSAGACTFKGYLRSIFGTTFAGAQSFDYGTCTFTGSITSCDPGFISLTAGDPLLNQLFTNQLTINGGKYNARAITNFCTGFRVIAHGAEFIVNDSDADAVFLGGFASADNLDMRGGILRGRWRMSSNRPSFRGVYLPYIGTANDIHAPIFSQGYIGDPDGVHFILGMPLDDDFEATGNPMQDFTDALPIGAWFGANVTTAAPAPPNVKFRIQNADCDFTFGGVGGFSRLYTQTLIQTRFNEVILPSRGKWSAKVIAGDRILDTSSKTISIITGAQETTTNGVGTAEVTSVISLNATPTGNPKHIAIYSTVLNSYFYYLIDSISGNDVTIIGTVLVDFLNTDIVFLISVDVPIHAGAKISIASNIVLPVSPATFTVPFDNLNFDDEGTFVDLAANADRITIPADVDSVDVSGYVQYVDPVDVTSAAFLRLLHFDSADVRIEIVAAWVGTISYTDPRMSVTALSIEVDEGDYFTLTIKEQDQSTEISQARLLVRKVK